ncbi:lysophospholipid acyltransferase family protein [Peptoclostridium sp. AF21-18]|uniref:lysophospholipid acyltransferase family protein n=1 Tax=Peptoclostridium sp. AF21-18 TaxID=2292243 RepID=UPI000E46EC16|nr:lysophospholipid acyltransferase family protein [Peptoclostridium sp. AF21-18]RHQ97962.1 1-acyl-sn-glycerol-3-phosphate acyltransferase [Peptoclostridium sp. AF21-18]
MKFYDFALSVLRLFCKVFFKYEVIGIENVPLEGNVIIAANHKSNLDPIFVASSMTTREVAAIAKKELFDHKVLGFILKKLNTIPIDRENTGISTVKQILRAIKDGYVLGLFPEGTRVRGKEFGQAKAGLSLFASKGKANVVPISVISSYKLFSRVKIYIGEPIDMSQYFRAKLTNEDHERISEEIMQVIIKNYCEQADGIVDVEGIEYNA